MQKNKKSYQDLTLDEAKKDSIVLAWGRFNPPTTGHEKLINTVVAEAKKRSADYRIYPTKTTDPKKNPLTFKEKVRFMRKMFPRHARKISSDEGVNTVIKAAQKLEKEGYKNLTIIAGSDRVQEFNTLLNKYNNKEYTFVKIDVVSAGERDPDAENVSGMSASKMRAAASAGDFASFKKGVPNARVARPLYNAVRKGMQVNERFEKDGIFEYVNFINEEKEEAPGVIGSRFNRLLRFGLAIGGTGDIPLTKRAFRDFDKAQTNPLLRKKVFDVTDLVFDYILTDTLLYNRFLLLLHRKYIFGEGKNAMKFHEFKSNLAEADGTSPLSTAPDHPEQMHFVARFPSPDYTNSFIKDIVLLNLLDINWKSGDGTEVQFYVRKSTAGQEAPASSEDELLRRVDRQNRYSGHNTTQYGSEARIVDLVMKHGGKISRFEGDVREGLDVEENSNLTDELLEGLLKKSWKSEVAYDILSEVYLRGLHSWEDECNKKETTTPDQWAYARVNSFVAGGKAQKENDADLWNEHLQREEEPLSEMDQDFLAELGTLGKAAVGGVAYYLWKKSRDKKKKDKETAEPGPEKKPEKTGWRSQVSWDKNEEYNIDEEFEGEFYTIDESFEKEISEIAPPQTPQQRLAARAGGEVKKSRTAGGEVKTARTFGSLRPRLTGGDNPQARFVGGGKATDPSLAMRMRKSQVAQQQRQQHRIVSDMSEVYDIDSQFELAFSEEHGAGDWGTDKLRKKYMKDTPGQNNIKEIENVAAVRRELNQGIRQDRTRNRKTLRDLRNKENKKEDEDRGEALEKRKEAIKQAQKDLQNSFVPEESPPSPKAERFIKKNKESFKDKYGERWKEVLYATSWKMHNKHWNKE